MRAILPCINDSGFPQATISTLTTGMSGDTLLFASGAISVNLSEKQQDTQRMEGIKRGYTNYTFGTVTETICHFLSTKIIYRTVLRLLAALEML